MNPEVIRDFIPTLFCQVLNISSVFQLFPFPFHLTLCSPRTPAYTLYLYIKFYNLFFTESPVLLPALGFSWPLIFQGTSSQVYGQSPQPMVFSLLSLWISNSQLLSLQVLPPLLFFAERDSHLFSPSVYLTLAGVWATAGTSLLSPATFLKGQAVSSPSFPPHKHCYMYHNRPGPPHSDFLHLAIQSLELISSAFNILWEHEISVRKWLLQKILRKFNSKATRFVDISQSQKSFQVFARGLLSTMSTKSAKIISGIFFNPSFDTVLYKLFTQFHFFTLQAFNLFSGSQGRRRILSQEEAVHRRQVQLQLLTWWLNILIKSWIPGNFQVFRS